MMYAWGSNAGGALGVATAGVEAPLPVRVPLPRAAVFVACGELASAAVTDDGTLWTWGAGRRGRLGHGDEADCARPRRVAALAGVRVRAVSVGQDHMLALSDAGAVWEWGSGRLQPRLVVADGVAQVAAGYQASLARTTAGRVLAWGTRAPPQAVLKALDEEEDEVVDIALGSVYGGVVTAAGRVLMWGYGRHGNLGTGGRPRAVSTGVVEVVAPADARFVSLACAVGQINVAEHARVSGTEGPHTLAVSTDGACWAWGTSHKGVLGNHRRKVLCDGRDELTPYRVGSRTPDDDEEEEEEEEQKHAPYLEGERVVQVLSASIHSACVTEGGRLFTWGCGSDGRLGLQRYLTGLTGHKSRMKCYVSEPTRVELPGRVLMAGTSRRHMVCLLAPEGEEREEREKKKKKEQ